MKISKPSFEIWEQQSGINGVYKQIERAGRVCYKSDNKMTDSSAKPFCDRMIANMHYAMLEHGTVYLRLNRLVGCENESAVFYKSNGHSRVRNIENIFYVTTNLRVLAENRRMDDLKYFCEPTVNHEKRITVHFTTQIAISREFNRHRVNSIAEQSTRYCNYSKNKFNSEINICMPEWVQKKASDDFDTLELSGTDFLSMAEKVKKEDATPVEIWLFANMAAELSYMNLIKAGCKPQEARVILPLDTATELVHTAFISDWLHFFDLRALDKTGPAHPDAKIIALPLYNEFKKLNLI